MYFNHCAPSKAKLTHHFDFMCKGNPKKTPLFFVIFLICTLDLVYKQTKTNN